MKLRRRAYMESKNDSKFVVLGVKGDYASVMSIPISKADAKKMMKGLPVMPGEKNVVMTVGETRKKFGRKIVGKEYLGEAKKGVKAGGRIASLLKQIGPYAKEAADDFRAGDVRLGVANLGDVVSDVWKIYGELVVDYPGLKKAKDALKRALIEIDSSGKKLHHGSGKK